MIHFYNFVAFAALGIPKRGIYDNRKTAADKVGTGKPRSVNARFEAMPGHYLVESELCSRSAGWEKGLVEKTVQDRRCGIWRDCCNSLDGLNGWLLQACRQSWSKLAPPPSGRD